MSTTRPRWWDGTVFRPIEADITSDLVARVIPAASGNTTTTTLAVSATTFNGSGTVTLTATVSGTPSGSVQFEQWSGSAWVAVTPTTGTNPDTGSPWTITKTISATTIFRARYLGNGTALASTSAQKTVTVKVLTTFVKTYNPSWGGTYDGGGAKRTSVGNDIYQGYYSSTNGNQRSGIGFPYATYNADLVGATVTKVELYLNAQHWGPDSGGTVRVGRHSNATEPATWGAFTGLTGADDTAWSTKTGAKWCDITSLGSGASSPWHTAGGTKGCTLGPGPTTAIEYYGYFTGPGDTGGPQLRITYTKYV